MPGCYLEICGKDFDPDETLKDISFVPYLIYRKGDRINRRNGGLRTESGFRVTASNASGDEVVKQLDEAESFLNRHLEELQSLRGMDKSYLDFGHHLRIGTGKGGQETAYQFDHIPDSLIRVCAKLNIGITMSLYPPPAPD